MKPVIRSALLVAFAALAFAVPASAQQVVYSEGFESGLGAWTATGLWNLEDSTDTCGSQAAPFPEGTKSAWYGSPSTCTFDTGVANSGTLTMNDWVDLPDVPAISVHFWMWIHSEYCWADSYGTQYDVFSVVVTRQVGSSLQFFQCGTSGVPATTQLNWHERQVDISAFRGQRVKVSFQFGSGDQLSNNYLGWLVDNVRILAEPGERICPSGSLASGCPCLPNYVPVAGGCRNSTGQSAPLFTDGSPVVSADTLSLRVEHMPPNASAILTQATGTGPSIVFGDGIRCISGSLRRMGTVAATAGVATWPPAGTDPIALRGAIPPTGGTRYYYVFYRDTQNYCNPALYNLTDTRRITWLP